MSHRNEQNSLLAAVGAATVALVLSAAVTSTVAFGFLASRTPLSAAAPYTAATGTAPAAAVALPARLT